MTDRMMIECLVTPEWTSRVQALCPNAVQGSDEKERRELLRIEMNILNKLLYKNKNQHRGSRFYRKLCKVTRTWRHLELLEERQQREEFWRGVIMASKNASDVHERRVPSMEMGVQVVQQVMEECELCEDLVVACLEAGKECAWQLAHSFFMPLSLTCLALVSRIQVLMTHWLQTRSMYYNATAEVLQYLPIQETGKCGLKQIDSAKGNKPDHLPASLRCVLERGKPPILRKDGSLSFESTPDEPERDLLGLCKVAVDTRQSTCMLGVMEDRGQPISRDEVLHLIASHEDAAGVQHKKDAEELPAFVGSSIVTGLMVSNSHMTSPTLNPSSAPDYSGLHHSAPALQVQIKEAVPPLPSLSKRKTAFIRVGGSTRTASKEEANNAIHEFRLSSRANPPSTSINTQSNPKVPELVQDPKTLSLSIATVPSWESWLNVGNNGPAAGTNAARTEETSLSWGHGSKKKKRKKKLVQANR